jgi:hypothetical protein
MADGDLFGAVLDCIIPPDRDPGALALGTDRFVLARLNESAGDAALITAGLAELQARAQRTKGDRFETLAFGDRVAMLEAVETEPWFARLVTLTSIGYYADPDNGGNAGARSWTMIGYRHRLPEGPSGPPQRQERARP